MREFGPLEQAIMDVMWGAERPLVVREICERLRYDRVIAYTTVMTVTNILHRKGMLDRRKDGRAWRYRPVETRFEHSARLMGEALADSDDRHRTLRDFIDRLDDEDVVRLRELIEGGGDGGGPRGAAASRPEGATAS